MLNTNGQIYTFGQNVYGELGVGSKTHTHIPSLVPNMTNIIDISGGKYHSIIQDRDGKVYVAGANIYGNLGNGNYDESLTFIQIPNFEDVMEISAGNSYTAIAKQDGTVWGFGDYNHGDEMFESQTNSNTPVQIGSENFKIEPKKAVIYVNDTEDLIKGLEIKEFNLFYTREKSVDDYIWKTSDEETVTVQSGILDAKKAGTVKITATDKITGTAKEIERVVVNHDKDRIEKISINTKEAEILEECKYKIVVEEKDKAGLLTIITKDKTDKVSLDRTNWSPNGILIETLDITEKETVLPFYVQTQNGTVIEYMLTIYIQSHDTNLEFIKVEGFEAVKKDEGIYGIHLEAVGREVEINAKTVDSNAKVRIETAVYEIQETTGKVLINAKETVVYIYVQAEDGYIQKYKLLISGLSDDVNIAEITVNGEKARYIDGENRYEIRCKDDEYELEVTLSDILASMKLGSNAEAIGIDKINVSKAGEKTIVEVTVTSQSKLVTQKYEIIITEKSSNANLDSLKVNEKQVMPELDGSYYIGLPNNTEKIEVEAIAEDIAALTAIEGIGNNTYIMTTQEDVQDRKNYL